MSNRKSNARSEQAKRLSELGDTMAQMSQVFTVASNATRAAAQACALASHSLQKSEPEDGD